MYFKVALVVTSLFLMSGCSNPFGPKPKAPKKNLGIEVVEEVPAVISESNTTISPVEEAPVIKKKKKTKPYLKPEPFSLESQESDPELLGPQTTLDTPLTRANDDTELENLESNKTK